MKRAFTLIEILVVITIIGIILAASTVSYTNAQRKARDGKRKSELKSVQQALELYFQTNGKYPGSLGANIVCNVTGDTSIKTWGTSFICGGISYLDPLPKDPLDQSTNGYYFTSLGTPPLSYVLSANLENTGDPDLTSLPCTPQAPRNYCVKNP